MTQTKAQQRTALVREFLADYAAMVTNHPARMYADEAGWIQLKLSCTRAQAERWVAQAQQEGQ